MRDFVVFNRTGKMLRQSSRPSLVSIERVLLTSLRSSLPAFPERYRSRLSLLLHGRLSWWKKSWLGDENQCQKPKLYGSRPELASFREGVASEGKVVDENLRANLRAGLRSMDQ